MQQSREWLPRTSFVFKNTTFISFHYYQGRGFIRQPKDQLLFEKISHLPLYCIIFREEQDKERRDYMSDYVEMLAYFGVSGAHPGGIELTKR